MLKNAEENKEISRAGDQGDYPTNNIPEREPDFSHFHFEFYISDDGDFKKNRSPILHGESTDFCRFNGVTDRSKWSKHGSFQNGRITDRYEMA